MYFFIKKKKKEGKLVLNWKAQSKNDPFGSFQLLLNTLKNGWKIKGLFLLWAFQLIDHNISMKLS